MQILVWESTILLLDSEGDSDQYRGSNDVKILSRICHINFLWKLHSGVPNERNMLQTQKKNHIMDSCASCVPYLASLWSAVQFEGFSFLHLNFFFSPVSFCWSKLNLIWGELILLLFLKCLSVPPLEVSATCFIETQVMCANMLYSCTFDILFFFFY